MNCRRQLDAESVPPVLASEVKQEFPLSSLEKLLVREALLLLLDTRTRALELTAEMCRRQHFAVPDVHDFQLPVTLDLLRRFGG